MDQISLIIFQSRGTLYKGPPDLILHFLESGDPSGWGQLACQFKFNIFGILPPPNGYIRARIQHREAMPVFKAKKDILATFQ